MEERLCQECGTDKCWGWYAKGLCHNCYDRKLYHTNNEYRKRKLKREKIYRELDPERYKRKKRMEGHRLRVKGLTIIGRGSVKCVNCGCDDWRLLEINHMKGGGRQEVKDSKQFFRQIINGKRNIDDLELRCKPCNSLHFAELRLGKLPFEIKWVAEQPSLVDLWAETLVNDATLQRAIFKGV